MTWVGITLGGEIINLLFVLSGLCLNIFKTEKILRLLYKKKKKKMAHIYKPETLHPSLFNSERWNRAIFERVLGKDWQCLSCDERAKCSARSRGSKKDKIGGTQDWACVTARYRTSKKIVRLTDPIKRDHGEVISIDTEIRVPIKRHSSWHSCWGHRRGARSKIHDNPDRDK